MTFAQWRIQQFFFMYFQVAQAMQVYKAVSATNLEPGKVENIPEAVQPAIVSPPPTLEQLQPEFSEDMMYEETPKNK